MNDSETEVESGLHPFYLFPDMNNVYEATEVKYAGPKEGRPPEVRISTYDGHMTVPVESFRLSDLDETVTITTKNTNMLIESKTRMLVKVERKDSGNKVTLVSG